MHVRFRTKLLENCYRHLHKARRKWGDVVGRQYVGRVGILKAIENLDDLKSYPSLRYHPLKGDRKGQHAVKLTDRYRLIFTVQREEMEIIQIEEVSKHYEN